MSIQWKIGSSSGGASSASTADDLNISGLKIVIRNHDEDVASWVCEGDEIDSVARFAYGTDISIWKVDGNTTTRVFRGVVTSIPREGEGASHRVSYEAKGGWYWLTKCYYEQSWASGPSGSVSKTRAVLGYDASGTVSANAQLSSILACAVGAGAPVAYASPTVSSTHLPGDEQVDMTCADAINRIVAWFPDTVIYFDYSGTGAPVCHMVRRAGLTALTLPVESAADKVSATPRHDLVVPGVKVVFEITSTENDKTYRSTVTQTAGNSSALGAAHFTVDLDGASKTVLWNKIKCEHLSASDLEDEDWWVAHCPELAGWTDVAFSGSSTIPTAGGWRLSNELVEGTVQTWQNSAAAQCTLWAIVSYTAPNGDKIVDQKITWTGTLTNAVSGVYHFAEGRQTAESVPDGLAADIYDSVRHLYYEGTVTYVDEAPPYIGSGSFIAFKLRLTGGLSAWATMDSAIQAIEYAVDTGSTTFTFGPPEHLGPQDIIQHALANRRRAAVRSQRQFASAELDGAYSESIGGPSSGSNTGRNSGTIAKQTFADPNGRIGAGDGSVEIDGPGGHVKVSDTDPSRHSQLTADGLTFSSGGYYGSDRSISVPNSTHMWFNDPTAPDVGALVFGIFPSMTDTPNTFDVVYRPIRINGGLIDQIGDVTRRSVSILVRPTS